MKIIIKFNLTKAIEIDFGYDNQMFKSMYGFSIDTVYYDEDGNVYFAKNHFNAFKHPKCWFK